MEREKKTLWQQRNQQVANCTVANCCSKLSRSMSPCQEESLRWQQQRTEYEQDRKQKLKEIEALQKENLQMKQRLQDAEKELHILE